MTRRAAAFGLRVRYSLRAHTPEPEMPHRTRPILQDPLKMEMGTTPDINRLPRNTALDLRRCRRNESAGHRESRAGIHCQLEGSPTPIKCANGSLAMILATVLKKL